MTVSAYAKDCILKHQSFLTQQHQQFVLDSCSEAGKSYSTQASVKYATRMIERNMSKNSMKVQVKSQRKVGIAKPRLSWANTSSERRLAETCQ